MTARGSLDRRELVLLRIRTEAGFTGLGEAVPMSLRGGVGLKAVVDELETWGAAMLDDNEDGSRMAAGFSAPARAAIAMATGDAEARRLQVPLHRLLAPGIEPQPVRCNATLTTDTPAGLLDQAETWAADGFTVFKLKLGSADDLGQVRAIRQGLGDGVDIRLDTNGTWDLDQASQILEELEPLRIELAEQPVEGLEGLAALRSHTSIPLVADEAVASPADSARAASICACDAATVKLSKTGSLDPGLGGSLPTFLSSALDGPVGIAAAAHVAQTLPRTGPWSKTAHGLATERLFAATIAREGNLLDGANLPVPPGPGLGITIDEAALKKFHLR